MELIDREAFVKSLLAHDTINESTVNDSLNDVTTIDLVRCKDCIYFQQEQVKTSEGTYRNKFPNEGIVSIDVGINIGSYCTRVVDVREEGFRDGEPTIERTYLWRNEDDFCSRGKRKTYEQGT